MELDKIDLIVEDVARSAGFFAGLGLHLTANAPRFAERGVILHFRVGDVDQAVERARSIGATVLLEPATTDWGWESAMIAGPEGIIVDLYRPVSPSDEV